MKKVLITGASGFVGKHVVDELILNGYEVHAISRQDHPDTEGTKWHKCDLFSERQVKDLLQLIRPEYLMHLAWEATPGQYMRSLENYRWVQASLALLRIFHQIGGQRALIAGSCAEYKWNGGSLEEYSSDLTYDSPYAACKNYMRDLSFHYAQQTSMSLAWGRLFFLYGPHEPKNRLVPMVISSLLNEEDAKCTEGKHRRDFLFVADAAAALVAILRSNQNGVFNIASGDAVEVRSIINDISHRLGKANLVRFGAIANPNEADQVQADVTRLRSLGWTPKVGIGEGLDRTIQWWRQCLQNRRQERKIEDEV
ncbi:NAD-dependent epimerase/dehydratase family protein [Cohnella mopanensis]|uniref:NAD-dependent epimerase/dehydratase family protein n=1 Tax=Cohnella mopanensis TaxID=2911966 RepID=UPI001EF9B2D5|nr:NAD(P)-dependent oxidoreductase [Cohnella mopanensis]